MSSDLLWSRQDLIERLTADGVPFEAPDGDERLMFSLVTPTFEGTAMLSWPENVALLSLVIPLQVDVGEQLSAICEAVARLNNALVMPGFGLDADAGLVYFRAVVPRRPDGSLDAAEVQRLVQTGSSTVVQFAPALHEVAAGARAAVDVVAAEA